MGFLKKGSYRFYFHLGKIGFKIPRFGQKGMPNKLANFWAGAAMNILERNRYKYYVKRKHVEQFERTWSYEGPNIALNPTYISIFGLINIVRHCPNAAEWTNDFEILYKGKWISHQSKELPEDFHDYSKLSSYCFHDLVEFNSTAEDNVRLFENKLYAVDYGDFNINRHNALRVNYIDYR